MSEEGKANSWDWRGLTLAAARNARTAFLAVQAVSLIVVAAAPEQTFLLWGLFITGHDVSGYAGRIAFMGSGVEQSLLAAGLTFVLSSVCSIGVRLSQAFWARVSGVQQAKPGEAPDA